MDHPGVRADLGAFIGAVATAAARYPAFYAIDVWRNPGVSSDTATEFCYCPHTEARFRDALQRRYRTLPALNAAWRRSLTAWSGVHVPRAGAAAVGTLRLAAVRRGQAAGRSQVPVGCVRATRRTAGHEPHRCRPRGARSVADDERGRSLRNVICRASRRTCARSPHSIRCAPAVVTNRGGSARYPSGRVAPTSAARTPPGGPLRLWAWAAISRGAAALSVDPWRVSSGISVTRRAKPGSRSAHRGRWPGSSVATVRSLHRCARILPESRSCGA